MILEVEDGTERRNSTGPVSDRAHGTVLSSVSGAEMCGGS